MTTDHEKIERLEAELAEFKARRTIDTQAIIKAADDLFHKILNPTVLKAGAILFAIEMLSDGDPAGARDSEGGSGHVEQLIQVLLALLGG